MSAWRVIPTPNFDRQLRKLDPQVARRIIKTLDEIAAAGNPRGRGASLGGDFGEFWKYRIGDWRVMCKLDDGDLVMLAVRVGHRSIVYRH